MQKHDWIIDVCEDLKRYAQEHNLAHLEGHLNAALTAAKHDVLLANVDALHNATRDCAVLGGSIGVCSHQGAGSHAAKNLALVRCR